MIRYRSAQARDISKCAHIIAVHPVLSKRYGDTLGRLQEAWTRIFGADALILSIAEDVSLNKTVASYSACFVTDAFADEIATPPFRWVGAELVKRVLDGRSSILTDDEVERENSTGGLNLLIWPSGASIEYENDPELRQASQVFFFESFRGYRLKRLQAQATHPMEMAMAINSGGWQLREVDRTHVQSLDEPAGQAALKPHLLEATLAMAERQLGTWINLFFAYRQPVIGFSRSEQHLLLAALQGGTDEELATQLKISVSAVKKCWASAYARVHKLRLPILVGTGENREGDRGKEKKQKLLKYLREHMEELRPHSLKLLASRVNQFPQ
jgi:hypothetical protein